MKACTSPASSGLSRAREIPRDRTWGVKLKLATGRQVQLATTERIFLAGDFNYPNIEWKSCRPLDGTRKRECQHFLDVLSSFDLHQIVSVPTRNDSLLDLILTTEPNNVSINVLDGVSDHNILHCEFVCALQKRENRAKVIFDYNRANVDELIIDLSAFSIDLLQSFHQRDVNTNWALIRDKLITA